LVCAFRLRCRITAAAQGCKTPLDRAKNDATRAAFHTAVAAAPAAAPAAAVTVPADLALLLSGLSLSAYGPALCSQLGVRSVLAARYVTDAELASIGMKGPERRMLLDQVNKPAPASAPAPVVAAVSSPDAASVAALLRPTGAKVALCIGCAAYAAPNALPNPVRDAAAMGAKLASLGFAVETVADPDIDALEVAVARFCRRLSRGAVAFFFFAGHGVAAPDGSNYMLPVNACPTECGAEALARTAVTMQDVLLRMKKHDCFLNVLIADACRLSPKARGGGGDARGMKVLGGFARMEAPRGSVIAFACEQDSEAQDGAAGGNGVFTAALLAHLGTPAHIDTVLIRVTKAVVDATQGAQTPWHNHSLVEENVCLF
jgi:hypothetical protein